MVSIKGISMSIEEFFTGLGILGSLVAAIYSVLTYYREGSNKPDVVIWFTDGAENTKFCLQNRGNVDCTVVKYGVVRFQFWILKLWKDQKDFRHPPTVPPSQTVHLGDDIKKVLKHLSPINLDEISRLRVVDNRGQLFKPHPEALEAMRKWIQEYQNNQ